MANEKQQWEKGNQQPGTKPGEMLDVVIEKPRRRAAHKASQNCQDAKHSRTEQDRRPKGALPIMPRSGVSNTYNCVAR